MARNTAIKEPPRTPAQAAKEFAAGIESVSQGIAWLQGQDVDAVEAARVHCGVTDEKYTLEDLRRVIERVKLWGVAPKPAKSVEVLLETGAVTTADKMETAEHGEEAGSTPETPSVTNEATSAASSRPADKAAWEPFDYAAAANKYSADIIARAEMEESFVPANILKFRDKTARLAHALLKLKQAEKQVKEKLDLAVEELDSAENSHFHKQEEAKKPLPLLDGVANNPATQTEKAVDTGSAAFSAPPPDSWRGVILHDLGLPQGIVKKMAEHEPAIVTLGELADWQSKKGDFWIKDLKGIGEEAAEKISKACDKYWAENPQPQ